MIAQKVSNCLGKLAEYEERYKGMQYFVDAMRTFQEAYLLPELSLRQRIENVAYTIFFLRYWRSSLKKCKQNVVDNFVTAECHIDTEIAASALINLIGLVADDIVRTNGVLFFPNLVRCQLHFCPSWRV